MMKRILLITLSCTIFTIIAWGGLLFNPSLSYSKKSEFGNISIFHNNDLPKETTMIINKVRSRIESSEIYDSNIHIKLCLNDGSFYPRIHPFHRGLAYAFSNISVMHKVKTDFRKGRATYIGYKGPNDERAVDLTWILSHEFTHNLQANQDWMFQYRSHFWQQEGYAEYIAREFSKKEKIRELLVIYQNKIAENAGKVPVFILEDGTEQNLLYYKFAILTKYALENKNQSYEEFMAMDITEEDMFQEVLTQYNL